MNFKRAIALGALLWVLIFFEVSVLMFGFKLDQTSRVYYASHYILEGIFVLIISLIYFRGKKIRVGFKQGLLLGITFILLGIILDSVIIIPLFMGMNYLFLVSGGLLISYVLALVITSVVGALKK